MVELGDDADLTPFAFGEVSEWRQLAEKRTAIGGHCSVNGTPPRKPSAQTLPPEIEIRDRDR